MKRSIVSVHHNHINAARLVVKGKLALCSGRGGDRSALGIKYPHLVFFTGALETDDAGRIGCRDRFACHGKSPLVTFSKAAPLPLAPWTKKTSAGLLIPLGIYTTQLRVVPATLTLRGTVICASPVAVIDTTRTGIKNFRQFIEPPFSKSCLI